MSTSRGQEQTNSHAHQSHVREQTSVRNFHIAHGERAGPIGKQSGRSAHHGEQPPCKKHSMKDQVYETWVSRGEAAILEQKNGARNKYKYVDDAGLGHTEGKG
jgi:hypothetical protein